MTNAITTRKWQPTNGRPARIVAECGKRKSCRRWDGLAQDEENHRRAALHLAATMRIYSPTLTSARQKDDVMVHIVT